MENIINIIKVISTYNDAQDFVQPVKAGDFIDGEVGLKVYLHAIPVPMDFSTILSRHEKGHYKCYDDIIQDVNLLFSNCASYNRNTTPPARAGRRLHKCFQEMLTNSTRQPLGFTASQAPRETTTTHKQVDELFAKSMKIKELQHQLHLTATAKSRLQEQLCMVTEQSIAQQAEIAETQAKWKRDVFLKDRECQRLKQNNSTSQFQMHPNLSRTVLPPSTYRPVLSVRRNIRKKARRIKTSREVQLCTASGSPIFSGHTINHQPRRYHDLQMK